VVAGSTAYDKPLLTLRLTRQPGTITCDANVGLLVRAAGKKRSQNRFFNWELTLNGGETFASLPTTTIGKTTIPNLPLLTLAGVRVSVTTSSGTGAWSPVQTILIH
jgi:hypothetical protein